MWKSQYKYKYKISSTEYNVNIVIEASKYISTSASKSSKATNLFDASI
jgi:hypothetical protein